MINQVYQLIKPRQIEVTYEEVSLTKELVVVRPAYLSICAADQRYYQGTRTTEVLSKKLPMALIHEGIGQVVYDPTNTFQVGDYVAMIPNTPCEQDPVISENYLRTSKFRSSGFDGFLQDYMSLIPNRLVKVPNQLNLKVFAFIELITVSVHAIKRFDRFSHMRKSRIGIWGDGNLGYISALILKYLYKDTVVYVLGKNIEKLNYFSFVDEIYTITSIPEDFEIDHAFECVGGRGSQLAINQIIDYINPEGTISLLGVSEYNVEINTRLILEKGLRLYGSSRSGREDFVETINILKSYPQIINYLENLIGYEVTVESIKDIVDAFDQDMKKSWGKTVLMWNK